MHSVSQINQACQARLDSLCALLMDTVQNGASVGFMAPLTQQTAADYWHSVFAAPAPLLWIIEQEGQVIGSVQLALCHKDNGRHRAEIQKLFVLSHQRGLGHASQLMQAAEHYAATHRCTLLVLDTQAGSPAERFYQQQGWQKAGEIPDFAASPDGTLCPTAYYYKTLIPPDNPAKELP